MKATKVTRLPPAIPLGNIVGPYPDHTAEVKRVLQRVIEWNGQYGVGGAAHVARLSGTEAWLDYLRGRSRALTTLDSVVREMESEEKEVS